LKFYKLAARRLEHADFKISACPIRRFYSAYFLLFEFNKRSGFEWIKFLEMLQKRGADFIMTHAWSRKIIASLLKTAASPRMPHSATFI